MRKVVTLACLISSVISINAQIIETGESNLVWGVLPLMYICRERCMAM